MVAKTLPWYIILTGLNLEAGQIKLEKFSKILYFYVLIQSKSIIFSPTTNQNASIAHEVGHAIGFWHEHTRPDRDDYVEILLGNVKKAKSYNFDKRTWGEIINLDVPYDYGSDMHYGSKVSCMPAV